MSMTPKHLWDALWPVVMLWVLLMAFAFWQDANWPSETTRQISFAALAVVATFLVLLATIMLRRMHGPDHLTIALSLAFATCSLMPFYLMANSLWSAYFNEHRFHLTLATAGALTVGAGVAILALITTTDDGSAEKQRAEGYAQGVADEQHDQHNREGGYP